VICGARAFQNRRDPLTRCCAHTYDCSLVSSPARQYQHPESRQIEAYARNLMKPYFIWRSLGTTIPNLHSFSSTANSTPQHIPAQQAWQGNAGPTPVTQLHSQRLGRHNKRLLAATTNHCASTGRSAMWSAWIKPRVCINTNKRHALVPKDLILSFLPNLTREHCSSSSAGLQTA
jgi:hypothetical protein